MPLFYGEITKSLQAAEAMKLTAKDLLNLGIIDEIIEEPIGGAHRNPDNIAQSIKNSLLNNLNFFEGMSKEKFMIIENQNFYKLEEIKDSQKHLI